MATWKDFTLKSVQTAIFTPNNPDFNKGKILAAILSKFKDRFNGEMHILPVPSMPPNSPFGSLMPHMILKSNDGLWQLNISPARTDTIWTTQDKGNFAEIVQECSEIQEEYVRETGSPVARTALVAARVCATDNPSQELIQRFCNEPSQNGPFVHSKAFEIHNFKVYTPTREGVNYRINSWVRCKTAETALDRKPVILVEQDLNTSEDEPCRFEIDQISKFFRAGIAEMDQILQLYFPE
jgi:hypothetical protein